MKSSDESAVEIYVVPLHEAPGVDSELMLSAEERARAGRFAFPVHRDRYINGRAALRMILAGELRCAPGDVVIDATELGRPICAALAGIDFNVSHSADLAIIGVARCSPLGVDVEVLRTVQDREHLSESFFTRNEAAAIAALPYCQRDRAFLTCWTRKEAVLKALGLGLDLEPSLIATGIDAEDAEVTTAHGSFIVQTFELASAVASVAAPSKLDVRMHPFARSSVHPSRAAGIT